jgi:hypothetical protein
MSDIRFTAKYLEARRFIKWMEQQHDDVTAVIGRCGGDRWSRRWYHWREECFDGLIDVNKVDEFLIDVFGGSLLLCDVPDDCFSTRVRRHFSDRSAVRDEAVAMVDAGASVRDAATKFGISVDTVRKWRRSTAA